VQRAHAVKELDVDEIVALEPAWLDWLASRNALVSIRAGVSSEDASERAECASWLPILAENRAAELFTRSADELALELLTDPRTCMSASTFLIFFRAHALTEGDLVELCGSADPGRFMTGLALRKRRGEPVDAEQARAAWERVPRSDRGNLDVQRNVLGVTEI
jgi:hypothetical protein